jgi:polyisoprenoid-binding protein YceI
MFKEQPSSRAIADTTHNMLSDRVLDAARYPKVEVRSVSVTGTPENATVTARIDLRGVQHDMAVPVKVEASGDRLVATGEFTLSQRKFGMTPYSALAGGLRVKDEVKVRFRIVAEKSPVTASRASPPRP